jgi:hypothetical protein
MGGVLAAGSASALVHKGGLGRLLRLVTVRQVLPPFGWFKKVFNGLHRKLMDSDRKRLEKEIDGEGDDARPLPDKGRQAAWKFPRRFPRFNVIASAKASLPGNDLTLHILSVKDVGRGGVGLFSREEVTVGADIDVSLYSKNANRVVAAESVRGGIVSVVDWKESVYLLNIRFQCPISSEHHLNFHRYLLDLEKTP